MVRNRLDELHSQSKHAPVTEEEEMAPLYKEEKKRAKEKGGAGNGSGGLGDAFESFAQFLARFEDVVKKIDTIQAHADEIRIIQKSLLMATHKDETKEARMNDLIHENKMLAQAVRNTIKKDQDILENKSPKKMTQPQQQEYRIKKTQVNTQSKRFYDIWTAYNNQQVEFRDKSKQLLVKRCKITNKNLTEDQIETMLDEGNTAVFAKSILDQENLARQQLSDLHDRHDELIKLERSIKEVHDMFLEIAHLVAEQGEMIDSIERNIMDAGMSAEAGRGHLQKAENYQISARKKKVCLFSVLSVLLLIVFIVILIEFGAFSGGSDSETVRTIIEERVVYVTASTTTSTSTTTLTSSSTTDSTASTTNTPQSTPSTTAVP
ncbi:hypothetical protein TCAL_00418 [Tigriopus californicus]|uniref:t-SNARE coiled-coil homology domain-containing protein n=1 Tax=Tigriopus californicus TaxID=6832 RepID=A0A553NAZ6_TIGCA|nr:syntaxin-3-like [Tigriopus californicus]TRY62614.1 hypothetical protein TCAL_00418 [Tigriopus californicus]|eukprot:TCALIF_00418-PA protein Name:"Similar to Syx1A Syntaxin-1A (Drosophila melanogaster)" AED:0.25 eAED:0.44 QI:0/-1/0/1/-1/1/1/0/377